MYKYVSNDGLAKSNDIRFVDMWNKIVSKREQKTKAFCEKLKNQNVKALHPDDGWVDRKENTINFCYPKFILDINIGDLIALGDYKEYRICKVVDIIKSNHFDITKYKFEELYKAGEK